MLGRCSGIVGRRALVPALVLLLAGCAVGPPYRQPETPAPDEWVAPRPHAGDLERMSAWWSRFDDPTLARLIDTAQRQNPTLDAAVMRIEAARANARASGAGEWPAVTLNSALRRSASGIPPLAGPLTTATVAADASWEIDLFGSVRYTREAARARVQAREAEWHDARTSLAAEVASTYVGLRACEALAAVQQLDADSRRQTVDLTERKVDAGLTAPADAALLRASLTDATSRLIGQRAECDVLVKSLALLSGEGERTLRGELAASAGTLPGPAAFAVQAVPAAALAQRPDLAAAERELAAASAEIGIAESARYPRITLIGSIGYAYLRLGGVATDGQSWAFGPALTLPLFDAGRRGAQADAARARFAELRALYMQRARVAVREVEEALTRLDAAGRRQQDAESAVRDFEAFLAAARTRWEVGLGNLIELEEARRQALNANAALIQLRRERVAQWINLYKALGGGWEAAATREGRE